MTIVKGGEGDGGYYQKFISKVNMDNKIIYYAKITLDYSLFINDNIAFNIGLYFGYDFLPKYQILAFSYYTYSSMFPFEDDGKIIMLKKRRITGLLISEFN